MVGKMNERRHKDFKYWLFHAVIPTLVTLSGTVGGTLLSVTIYITPLQEKNEELQTKVNYLQDERFDNLQFCNQALFLSKSE